MHCINYIPIYKDTLYEQTDPHGDIIETSVPTFYAEFCWLRKDYINKNRDCEDCTVRLKIKEPSPYELPIAV